MGSDLGHTVASIIHSVKRAESHLKIIIIRRRRTLKRKQLFAFVELKLVLSLNQWIQPFIIIFWMHFPVRWCWCIQSYYSNKNHRKEAPWSEAEGLWPPSLWRECQSVLLLGQGHRLWWPWAEIKIKNRVKNWTTFILHPPHYNWILPVLPLHLVIPVKVQYVLHYFFTPGQQESSCRFLLQLQTREQLRIRLDLQPIHHFGENGKHRGDGCGPTVIWGEQQPHMCMYSGSSALAWFDNSTNII